MLTFEDGSAERAGKDRGSEPCGHRPGRDEEVLADFRDPMALAEAWRMWVLRSHSLIMRAIGSIGKWGPSRFFRLRLASGSVDGNRVGDRSDPAGLPDWIHDAAWRLSYASADSGAGIAPSNTYALDSNTCRLRNCSRTGKPEAMLSLDRLARKPQLRQGTLDNHPRFRVRWYKFRLDRPAMGVQTRNPVALTAGFHPFPSVTTLPLPWPLRSDDDQDGLPPSAGRCRLKVRKNTLRDD